MIKVIFVENNEVKMSKKEFEKLLEETYMRGKEENYEAAYNKGYKDGYCGRYWYGGGISCTTTTSTDGPTITYLNSTGKDNTYPNPWQGHITYCDAATKAQASDTAVLQSDLTSTEGCYVKESLHPEDYVE